MKWPAISGQSPDYTSIDVKSSVSQEISRVTMEKPLYPVSAVSPSISRTSLKFDLATQSIVPGEFNGDCALSPPSVSTE